MSEVPLVASDRGTSLISTGVPRSRSMISYRSRMHLLGSRLRFRVHDSGRAFAFQGRIFRIRSVPFIVGGWGGLN